MLKNLQECSVMFIYGTYVLEGEADAKFSLGEIWNLLQAPNNASNFCRQMINCMRAWNYIQKISGSPLNIEIIKQTHKRMKDKEKHQDGKDVLVGELESRLHLQVIFLHQLALLKDILKVQFLGFMKQSFFHRGGRRHYIRAVKMFDRKLSMLYTMIIKSLIHCWDKFEQNAKMFKLV